MGFLYGVGAEGEVLKVVVIAGMGDGALGEETVEDFEAFVGDSATFPEIGDVLNLQVYGDEPPQSQSKDQPTVGEDVRGHRRLGELDWTANGQARDPSPELNGLGVLGNGGKNGEWLHRGYAQELGGPEYGVVPVLGVDSLLHCAPLVGVEQGDAEIQAAHELSPVLKWGMTSLAKTSNISSISAGAQAGSMTKLVTPIST